jgi:hypothetical protein
MFVIFYPNYNNINNSLSSYVALAIDEKVKGSKCLIHNLA